MKFASCFAGTAAGGKPIKMKTFSETSLMISFSNICVELKANLFFVSE